MECRLDGVTVHYESFGSGRPLIFLPGWPDSGRVPADNLEPLFNGRPGWRRIYLDLPGRGATKGEPWITTNHQVLDIVLRVVDQVVPGERFVLAGHSAGAYLARAALKRRFGFVDGLLQVVPVIDPRAEDMPDPVTLVSEPGLIERITAELGSAAAPQFARVAVVGSADVYERVKPVMQGARDDGFLKRLDDKLSFDVDDLPAPFPRPTLFVLGRQDAIVGFRGAFNLLAAYPRATVALLDRAGHGLPWEQEQLFRALVGEWLSRVEEVSGDRPDTA
jgi:pimeloyl-ACP methyl ester carboxylesterase